MNFKDRLLWHFFKINLNNTDDRNAWYLVVEIFWAAILGSIATFNAAYAIRLGADNFQVSLLSSAPALLAALISFPAGKFFERRSKRMPWIMGSLLIYRAGFLLVAAVPWLGFIDVQPGLLAVLILILIGPPAHFFNVGWIAMLGEVVPEGKRAAVFAARNITNQITVGVVVFLCGLWLTRITFPINYQSLYLVGFLSAMLSSAYLLKLHVPDSVAIPRVPPEKRRRPLSETLRAARAALTDHPAFMRITLNTLLHGFGVWMAAPLYTLYYVRQLNASESWLGLNGTIASIGTIAGFSLWRWLISKWGEPVSLKRTIVLIGLYPMLVGLTPSLPVILVYGVLNGLIVPGTNLSHFNLLLKVTPPEARPTYTAIYVTIMNIGAFISPLISVAIADTIGLAPMLVISGLLSIIGSTSFWWRPVVEKEHEHPREAEPAV